MLSDKVVHRITPLIKEYGSGQRTYHVEVSKLSRWFYTENPKKESLLTGIFRPKGKKKKYLIDVLDNTSMYDLQKRLKELLEQITDDEVILDIEPSTEFILHSKPEKITAGTYLYRGYTVCDISYDSKEWVVYIGEHREEYFKMKKGPTWLFKKTSFRTLQYALENIDIYLDGKTELLTNE